MTGKEPNIYSRFKVTNPNVFNGSLTKRLFGFHHHLTETRLHRTAAQRQGADRCNPSSELTLPSSPLNPTTRMELGREIFIRVLCLVYRGVRVYEDISFRV